MLYRGSTAAKITFVLISAVFRYLLVHTHIHASRVVASQFVDSRFSLRHYTSEIARATLNRKIRRVYVTRSDILSIETALRLCSHAETRTSDLIQDSSLLFFAEEHSARLRHLRTSMMNTRKNT